MSCQIELEGTPNVICGLPALTLCSTCGKEICINCMTSCCVLPFCAACEREHIIAKHNGYRPRRSQAKSASGSS